MVTHGLVAIAGMLAALICYGIGKLSKKLIRITGWRIKTPNPDEGMRGYGN